MRLLATLAALLLCGCSTLESLENRVSCSADGKHAYINSLYGPVGVTSKIAAADAKVICKEK